MLFERLFGARGCRNGDVVLLRHPTDVSDDVLESRSFLSRDSTVFIESILLPLARHANRPFRYLSLPIEPKGLELRFWWSLQNIFHDIRFGLKTLRQYFPCATTTGLLMPKHLPISDSLLYTRGPSNGLIIIFDMRNVGMRHLLRPSIETLKTFFRYLQEALPAKLEAMHIVNCVSFFDMVLSMIKPFMKSEIIRKVRHREAWLIAGFFHF